MTRIFHRWRCIQLVVSAYLVCSTTPGFAETTPQDYEDQTPAESAVNGESSAPDTEASTPGTEESSPNTDDSALNTDQSETGSDEPATDTSDEPAVAEDSDPEKADPSIILKGRVWRTKPGIVFLKTPVGLLSLSSKTTLKDLLASQEISFWVHDTHLAIDIRKRKDGSLIHRYLSGPFTPSENDESRLLTWTPNGTQSFDFGARQQSFASVHPGDPITVEVDETDTVIGVHDLQFDLQIGQIPPPGSSAHVLLTGTVAKMKSNFIFLRTPVGVVNVNTKIGITGAKIGQTLTLHIHDREVIVDLAEKPAK